MAILPRMPRQRTEIRSYDVMPAILELLKQEKPLKTKVITERMQFVANAKGLPFRGRAVGRSLTSLEFTLNLPFAEWTGVLGSERLTGALLDRLTHHVHILEMNGDSYRLKTSKQKRAAERAK